MTEEHQNHDEKAGHLNQNSYISIGIVVLLIGGISWIQSSLYEVRRDQVTKESFERSTEEIKSRVAEMDRNGTQGSHMAIQNNTERIKNLEEVTNKLVPDVTQIRTDMSWISDWVKKQKEYDARYPQSSR